MPFRRCQQLGHFVSTRAKEWVQALVGAEPGLYRVQDDIAHDVERGLLGSEHAVEVTILPETSPLLPPKAEARASPECVCTLSTVGERGPALDQCMKVVRHQAVRNDFNVPTSRGTQKLRLYPLKNRSVREVFVALEGAHREENTLRTDVAVVREARWSAVRHARRRAIRDPSLGLRLRATRDSRLRATPRVCFTSVSFVLNTSRESRPGPRVKLSRSPPLTSGSARRTSACRSCSRRSASSARR